MYQDQKNDKKGENKHAQKSAKTKTSSSKSRKNTNQSYHDRPYQRNKKPSRFAAIDLGTNNCRLLIAAPKRKELRIVDAFSRIVRLGENLSQTGELSQAAMERTIAVLKICADKMHYRGVTHMRCVATQACRGARNGTTFIETIKSETGLNLELITPEEEARLAALGCTDLFDEHSKAILVFDIGGGSTEISWIDQTNEKSTRGNPGHTKVAAWASLPFGVVSLAERWNGHMISRETYEKIIEEVRTALREVGDRANLHQIFKAGHGHLLGTSGTVTSIAGIHLKLEQYRRTAVDGLWLDRKDALQVNEKLRAMSFEERANQPCIGHERADLVVYGCAILEAILLEWPSERIRVADRGLREGMLIELSQQAKREQYRPQNRKK